MPKYDVMDDRNPERFTFVPLESPEETDEWHAMKVKTEAAVATDVTEPLVDCL
jgi:hypothetical protein